jgi:hypothetical protein
MKESSFWPGGIHWPLRDAQAIRILVLLFVKNEQATSSPKKGYLYSALEENLPMSAQSRDLIRPNCAPAILVQQLSDCAGSTPCACSHTRTPLLGAPRQTGLLCLFALREVQRVVCVCAHYNKSRGQRTQCVLRPAKRATRRLEAARKVHLLRSLPRPGDHLAALWATCLAWATSLCLGIGPVVRSTLWQHGATSSQSRACVGSHRVTLQHRSVRKNAP